MPYKKSEKIKILLLDFLLGDDLGVCSNINPDMAEIVARVTTAAEISDAINAYEWEYIFVTELENMENIQRLLNLLGVDSKQVLYTCSYNSIYTFKGLLEYILLDCKIKNLLSFFRETVYNEYICATVEGITYMAHRGDATIMPTMYSENKNWAKDEMWIFHRLSKEYYDIDLSNGGYFCDLGANIGTTCIYFKKIMEPSLGILAFEPVAHTYKILKTNFLINDLGEDCICEKLGMSDIKETQQIHYAKGNPGGNSILINRGEETEEIELTSFDEYIEEKNINPKDIKYMWVDTEGYEPKVLKGAQKTLVNNAIPLFMEYNPGVWKETGQVEMLLEVLTKAYSKYIIIPEEEAGQRIEHNIMEIKDRLNDNQYDIFLIK